MSDIQLQENGFVTIDGLEVAYVDDSDIIYLNPSNWLTATRDMTLAEQGALARLIQEHRPSKPGVMS